MIAMQKQADVKQCQTAYLHPSRKQLRWLTLWWSCGCEHNCIKVSEACTSTMCALAIAYNTQSKEQVSSKWHLSINHLHAMLVSQSFCNRHNDSITAFKVSQACTDALLVLCAFAVA
jgi:hypothetical protein